MIDEIIEAKQYLNGEKINKHCMYRIIWLITKYYREEGLDQYAIRERLFDWGHVNHVYFDFDINKPIFHAYKDKAKLRTGYELKISDLDVQEILKRFDNRNTRMIALALLCIAKMEADKDGVFDISLSSLGNWIGIAGQHISSRYMYELTAMHYVQKNPMIRKKSWDDKSATKATKMKILVPFKNVGDYIIKENDIGQAFNDLIVGKTYR